MLNPQHSKDISKLLTFLGKKVSNFWSIICTWHRSKQELGLRWSTYSERSCKIVHFIKSIRRRHTDGWDYRMSKCLKLRFAANSQCVKTDTLWNDPLIFLLPNLFCVSLIVFAGHRETTFSSFEILFKVPLVDQVSEFWSLFIQSEKWKFWMEWIILIIGNISSHLEGVQNSHDTWYIWPNTFCDVARLIELKSVQTHMAKKKKKKKKGECFSSKVRLGERLYCK